MPGNIGAYIGFAVTVIWFVGIIVWCINRNFGKTITAEATIVHKQITEDFSKYSHTGKSYHYYVTFKFNGKRRSFKVSKFSYNGYKVGEKGTLKYKADRLIDFS